MKSKKENKTKNKKPKIEPKQIPNYIPYQIQQIKHWRPLKMIIGNYNTSRLNSTTKKSVNNTVMRTVKEILQ